MGERSRGCDRVSLVLLLHLQQRADRQKRDRHRADGPEKLKILYYPDDIFVYADREKMIEVIANLITNAIKFTKEGTITVASKVGREDNMVQVTVSDTGTRIDPEVMPKIFDKFVTKLDSGTGIGLYISKKIVEVHGRVMQAANRQDCRGAIVSFKLPLTKTSELPESK